MEKILKAGVIGALYLVPWVPLVVAHGMFFPFVTGKAFTLHFLVGLAVIGWLILAVKSPSYRPRLSPGLISLLIFLVVIGVANLAGHHPSFSFWSNFERMEGYLLLLYVGAFFVVASSVLTTDQAWRWFFHISMVVSIIIGLQALGQLGEMNRVFGTLGNPIYLAAYMIFHIFLALFYLDSARQRRSPVTFFYWAVILLGSAVLVLTFTRGAMLGLLGGGLLSALLIALLERQQLGLRRVATWAVAGAVMVAGVLGGIVWLNHMPAEEQSAGLRAVHSWADSTPVLSRFTDISVTEGGGAARLKLWSIALQGFQDRPILGWGQDNYGYVFDRYYDPSLYDRETWFDRAHNVTLDWLVSGGSLGFLAYLALFGAAVWLIWRDPNNSWSVIEKSVLSGLLLAYFIHNFFVFDNLATYVMFFAFLAFITARTTTEDRPVVGGRRPVSAGVAYAFSPVVVLLVGTTLFLTTWQPMSASAELIRALSLARPQPEINRAERYQEGLEYFELAYERSFLGRQETLERTNQKAIEAEQVLGRQSPVAQAYFEAAERMTEEYLETNPDRARILMFYGQTLSRFGRLEQAEAVLGRALEASPGKQVIMQFLAEVHLNQEDWETAIEITREALELAPTNRQARIAHAVALRYAGEEEQLDSVLEPLSTEERLSERLLMPLVDQERYDELVELRQERLAYFQAQLEAVEQEIEGAGSYGEQAELEDELIRWSERIGQEYVSIAAAWVEHGRPDLAIAELEIAIEQFPQFGGQLESFMQQLEAQTQ